MFSKTLKISFLVPLHVSVKKLFPDENLLKKVNNHKFGVGLGIQNLCLSISNLDSGKDFEYITRTILILSPNTFTF